MNDIRLLELFLVWCKEVCCSWGSKQEPTAYETMCSVL